MLKINALLEKMTQVGPTVSYFPLQVADQRYAFDQGRVLHGRSFSGLHTKAIGKWSPVVPHGLGPGGILMGPLLLTFILLPFQFLDSYFYFGMF